MKEWAREGDGVEEDGEFGTSISSYVAGLLLEPGRRY